MSSSAFGFLCDCTVIVQESNSDFSSSRCKLVVTLLRDVHFISSERARS